MATSAPAAPVPDIPRRTLRPGGVEDRYQSLFVIGRGGMGTVEVALERGAGGFERVVALKRLLPEQARDPRHKEMFLREARLAALLKHPNVVHAFAFGELYGELFLAMEYVEGETLARVLLAARERSGGRLDPALVAFVLAGACDGLHAAHELRDVGGQLLNVVHRDVSPQNVMIAYEGHVKILDFGVAKFDTSGHETRTGEVKGKMAYMSPEQALGEKLDRRSDLFSVGVLLFEALTGERMWGTGTDMEVMRRLALEEPPRLDAMLPDAPGALVELHARLVAHDREDRPATAKDVADELRAFASSWPAPDATTVRAMMQGLFDEQAQRRRERLTESLRQAAPNKVESLRKTLDPTKTFDRTMIEAVIVGSERPPAADRASPRKRSWGVVAGVGVVLAVAASAVVGLRGTTSTATPMVPAATATAAATVTPTPTPTPTPTASSTPSPTTTTSASATTTRTTTRTTTTTTTPKTVRARGMPSKLPDVDPTPF
ncbi:MAG: serine/threonine-protein kinase [Polyangiaceae bacterium]|jgi:serine/threonine-protein kinase